MKQITVTVDDAHLAVIGQVVEHLRARGMHVERVLSAVGIVTGSAPEQDCSTLDTVTGVVSVVEQQQVRLPPSDSDVQ